MRRGSALADSSDRARTTLLHALGVIRGSGLEPTRESILPTAPPARRPDRIYLVGFMGSGKSTIGPALAKRLRWTFVDLDGATEERAGLSVSEIFRRFGERHFRKLEYEALRDVSRSKTRTVVALGGGAYVSEVNRRIVAESGIAVWLDVPFRLVIRRVGVGNGGRPLAKSTEQLRALHKARLPFYHEADIRIRTGAASPDVIARAIVRMIREDWSVVAERRRLLL